MMQDEPPPLEDGDFYYEGPYLVFTAAYLRKRGFCCGSGCRHCPYDVNGNPVPAKGGSLPSPRGRSTPGTI